MSLFREREEFFTNQGANPATRTIKDVEPFIRKANLALVDADLTREVISISSPIIMSFGPVQLYNGAIDYTRRTGHLLQYPGTRPINGERPGFIIPVEKLLFYENNNGILHLFDPEEEYVIIKDRNDDEVKIKPRDLRTKYTDRDMVTWTPRHP